MTIKNIMVHLDQGARTAVRLKLAVDLARHHQARLVGVFGQRGQAQQVGLVSSWPSAEYAAAAEASQALFCGAVGDLPSWEWVDINRGSDTEVIRLLVENGRHFDFIILGQHEEGAQHLPKDLAEMMILDSGRPVLVVPYVGVFDDVFAHPLVAWNDAREAARALNDALPLIQSARETVVVRVAWENKVTREEKATLLKHLEAHGISARYEVVTPKSERVQLMDALLNTVSDQGATLLVMGAKGNGNNLFKGQGAGTRYILEHMTVPVLMAH